MENHLEFDEQANQVVDDRESADVRKTLPLKKQWAVLITGKNIILA